MLIRHPKFHPEAMLSLPRRSAGVINDTGSHILYTVSSYSFSKHEQSSEVRVLDTESSESLLVDDNTESSNPVWIGDECIALLRGTDKGTTELIIGKALCFKETAYVAGTIGGPADNLKITSLDGGHYGLAITASAHPDSSMYSPKFEDKRYTSGKLYRSLFVRHWDKYVLRQRNAIWFGTLNPTVLRDDGQITFAMSEVVNALKGTALESPISPLGSIDQFDISKKGLVFVAKDPDLDPAQNTRCKIYYVPLSSFAETTPEIMTIDLGDLRGALASPVFSKNGESVASLAMQKNGYEADRNRICVILDVNKFAMVVSLFMADSGTGSWDRSPSDIAWTSDGSGLFIVAQQYGRNLLFHKPLIKSAEPPTQLTYEGSISSMKVLGNNTGEYLFLSSTSLIDSSFYSFLVVKPPINSSPSITTRDISSISHSGSMFGLARSQITEIWFPGAGPNPETKDKVHAWVVKPSDFSEAKRYPLAFLVHGGPQGAWLDSWSTRWNPALFAEQGFVVVCPNPTGSTGYGQAFTDAIRGQWGGLPYQDLVNCMEYLEKHVHYIDMDRAVGLGASYGGFMMNWIQGHSLGRKFKALVTHDGVFCTSYEIATDELYFIKEDLGNFIPDNERFHHWDPLRFVQNWKTPHLVIHSDLDYRLLVGDGLATFNVLQMQGIESEFLTFPDENHFVLKPENALVWQETVFNFVNRHVGLPLYKEGDAKQVIQDPPRSRTREIVEELAAFDIDY